MSDHGFDCLVEVASYDFISLCVIPMDRSLPPEVEDSPAELGRVRETNGYLVLDRPTSSTLLGHKRVLDHFQASEAEAAPNAAIEHLAIQTEFEADFLVGSAAAVLSKPSGLHPRRLIYCTWPELLNYLRLLCVAHEHFEAVPRFWVNEGFYYLYRTDILFPESRKASFFGQQTAERRLEGLWRRLEFFCRSIDGAEIASLRTPNNDTEARALYYLAFQNILATGIFDDLAALADSVYSLGLDRHHRTLRRDRNGRSIAIEAVSNHNRGLADFLDNERVRKGIGSFYPIRDALQHREFPTTMGVMRFPRQKLPSVMVASEAALRDLAEAVADEAPPIRRWVEGEGMATAELAWLSRSMTLAVDGVVNGFLRRVPWRELGDPTRRDDGDALWQRFSESPAKFIEWGRDPVFLGAGIQHVEW